jgi:Zn-dependent M28 family amino/carboxypeptidase
MQKAKDYVRAECKKLGLQTYTQDVAVKGGTCQNVIAVLEGQDPSKRIVIGAHLDHIGQRGNNSRDALYTGPTVYNGADDNASGSAAVLALAKRLAKTKPGCTIEFHWYTGEEQNLLGSKYCTQSPVGKIDEYKLMVNLDMVGRLKQEALVGDAPFPFDLTPLYAKYPFAEGITIARDTRDSDHSSWWQAGVPAVLLHTGLHPDYHKPGDDPDKINYDGLVKVCQYTYDLVCMVDQGLVPTSRPVVKPNRPILY